MKLILKSLNRKTQETSNQWSWCDSKGTLYFVQGIPPLYGWTNADTAKTLCNQSFMEPGH